MNLRKINYSLKVFTPLKISLVAIAILGSIVLWQTALLYRKSELISTLSLENADLKHSLSSIDGQLANLEDKASDVRIFQRELIRVIKNIDQSYPVSMARLNQNQHEPEPQHPLDFDPASLLSASESIFKLSSSHENLALEAASLLGRALTLKDILDKTPNKMPVSNGYISSLYGFRPDPFTKKVRKHHGIDIAAPIGTPVLASAGGLIKVVREDREFGKLVELDHGAGLVSRYAHMSATYVHPGERVKPGQMIGRVGNTGSRCHGAHLHFEISKNNKKLDPKPYIINKTLDFKSFS